DVVGHADSVVAGEPTAAVSRCVVARPGARARGRAVGPPMDHCRESPAAEPNVQDRFATKLPSVTGGSAIAYASAGATRSRTRSQTSAVVAPSASAWTRRYASRVRCESAAANVQERLST